MDNVRLPVGKIYMTVSDNKIAVEKWSDVLKNLGKKGLNVSKNWQWNVIKNPGRALDIPANVASSVVSRISKAVSSTLPEVIKFYHTKRGVYLGKFFGFHVIYMEQKTRRLYQSVPPEEDDLGQRLEKNKSC